MKIFSYIKRHLFLVSATTIFIIIVVIIAGRAGSQGTDVTTNTKSSVSLVNVEKYRKGNLTLPADGTVESDSQAELKSQVSAPIAAIHVAIGQSVAEGQTILELENTDIRAQLAQSEAALALAKGQYETGDLSLNSAKKGAIDKINDAYIKVYDTVNTQIDPLLNNYNGQGGSLYDFIGDYRLRDEIRKIRINIDSYTTSWKASIDSLSQSSSPEAITAELKRSQNVLSETSQLLADIAQALNDSSYSATAEFSAFLSTWKNVTSQARATISGSTQALTGAEATLSNSISAQGSTAPAQVQAAEAGVRNLRAQLQKTIIKSPINGKIAALPLRQGELASPGALLAGVVGRGGMVVKAYVSSEDAPRIKQGATSKIRGNVTGRVESFSPSLSSDNKKVEVIIRVDNPEKSGLIVGDRVQAEISAANSQSAGTNNAAGNSSVYLLPIQDVKIIPGSAFVYTVDEQSKIRRNDVILGEIQGDFIEVKSGLNDSMNIVSPVYELDEGQEVDVK